jgi:hypothetical protein
MPDAAVRYEGSKEFKADEMPEHQGGAAVFYQLNAFAVLGAEYLYGTFDDEETDDRHLATLHSRWNSRNPSGADPAGPPRPLFCPFPIRPDVRAATTPNRESK